MNEKEPYITKSSIELLIKDARSAFEYCRPYELGVLEYFNSLVSAYFQKLEKEKPIMNNESSIYIAAKKFIQAVDNGLAEKNDFAFMKHVSIIVEAEQELVDVCVKSVEVTRNATLETI